MVLAKKNHPSLKQFFAAHIVPCKDNIDQNPGPLSKSFWGLLKKVSGHFVIPTGFPICHSTNVARELSKCLDGFGWSRLVRWFCMRKSSICQESPCCSPLSCWNENCPGPGLHTIDVGSNGAFYGRQYSLQPCSVEDGRFPVSARANLMIRGDAQCRGQPQKRGGIHRVDSCCDQDWQSVRSNKNTAVLDCLSLNHLVLGI